MKFYKKVRFWGGLGMAAQPVLFSYLPDVWIIIGLCLSFSCFLKKKKLSGQ